MPDNAFVIVLPGSVNNCHRSVCIYCNFKPFLSCECILMGITVFKSIIWGGIPSVIRSEFRFMSVIYDRTVKPELKVTASALLVHFI